MKTINDIYESVLDTDFGKNVEFELVKDWLSKHSAHQKYVVDPKTLEINADYLFLGVENGEEWPPFIKFGNIKKFRLEYNGSKSNRSLCIELPKSCIKYELDLLDIDTCTLNGDINSPSGEFRLYGDIKELNLNGKLNIYKFHMGGTRDLEQINGIQNIKCDTINFPYKIIGNAVRKAMNLKGAKNVMVQGNTLG